jgi:hypothetical protein
LSNGAISYHWKLASWAASQLEEQPATRSNCMLLRALRLPDKAKKQVKVAYCKVFMKFCPVVDGQRIKKVLKTKQCKQDMVHDWFRSSKQIGRADNSVRERETGAAEK